MYIEYYETWVNFQPDGIKTRSKLALEMSISSHAVPIKGTKVIFKRGQMPYLLGWSKLVDRVDRAERDFGNSPALAI